MNLQNLMLQAQKMQKELTKKMADFDSKDFEYGYQNNSIIVKLKGDLNIKEIIINDTLIDVDEKAMLQEMIVEAVNYAIGEVNKQKNALTSKSMPNPNGAFPGSLF